MKNPNYLGSWDLVTPEGDYGTIDVQILSATQEMVQNGDKKEECMVLQIKGYKPMICNTTNAKAIAQALGSDFIEDWAGKTIRIGVKKVRAFGDMHNALRVLGVGAPPKKEELNPQHPHWDRALAAMRSGKTSLLAIHVKYSLSEESKALLLAPADTAEEGQEND